MDAVRLSFGLRAAAVFCCVLGFFSSFATGEENTPPTASASKTVDFAKDIQPILRKNCYSCHGAEEQEGGLRLDVKKRAMQGGDGGAVFVAGKSDKSRLIRLVAGLDEEVGIMPPDGEGTPLSDDQVALLRLWIDQGAIWPESADAALAGSNHWSFQPITRPEPPKVKNSSWVRNPIDAFVAARHEREKITPSPEADRETLIRRVYLDLIGLPPTAEQLDEFLNDSQPDAYERLVNRVLESNHYGERWGRHWLDLARYADSDGYEKDRARPWAWRYREWVIAALNADMPFDQFTIEQIAGDMLPDATSEQRVASGFHRNTLHNTEGGTDQEEDRVKKTVDRTNTMATIWLGLTLGCAQCHSHKYDPITQREYYSMYAFFNNINETDIDAPLSNELSAFAAAKAKFDAEHAKLQAAVAEYEKTKLPAAQAAWEQRARSEKPLWRTLDVDNLQSAKGATLTKHSDGSVLATGKNELSDVYTIDARPGLSQVAAIRLEVLPDKSLVKEGPGRANNGNFVLTTIRAAVLPADGGDAKSAEFRAARADFSQSNWEVEKAINSDPKDGWAVSPEFGKRHVAVFALKQPVKTDDARLSIVLDQTYSGPEPHNIGRFRLSVTDSAGPIELDGLPAAVAEALAVSTQERTKEQQQLIAAHYRSLDPELAKLQAAVTEHAKKAPQAGGGTKAQAVAETANREARIHVRGDFLNHGEKVETTTLDVLPTVKPRGRGPDRLDLARWLVADENPLTARVTVNRIWQQYFGRGIVATSDDFGTQGERPTHPELLDWLASEFRDSGWRLKHLHKLIVTSATYRQSSALRPELAQRDPENALLARQRRLRVEAEIVRDLALAVSGLLEPKIGGPSVRPPQPAEYSQLTYANSAKWDESKGGDRYRRGLYTFFQRTSPYPMLMTFDSPDSTECTAQRVTSNTPLQALTVWNDRVFWECAQHIGRRIVREVPAASESDATNHRRAEYAFKLCLARQPDAEELAALIELFDEQAALCDEDKERTTMLVGSAPLPEGSSRAELAGWIAVGRVLINLDEFITRE